MWFGVLGPVLVEDAGMRVAVQSAQLRVLLVTLLADANKAVSVADLERVLWGDDPPASARASLYNQVMRLRRQLGPEIGARIRTEAPGYLIEVRDGELDEQVFLDRWALGRAALQARDWAAASRHLERALALWRGEPGGDLPTGAADGTHRLTEIRLLALEGRLEAELHLGRHREIISEIRALTGEYPLYEAFHGQLMLALYRSSRQAEALEAFRRLRRTLLDELGVEPVATLQHLHRRILNADPGLAAPDRSPRPADGIEPGTELREPHRRILPADPALTVPAPGPPAAGAGPIVPRQLPGAVPYFTGRVAELAVLTALLDQAGNAAGSAVVAAIGGTAGIGKTALAVRWARQVSAEFPDGQLYVNLRGHDPSGTPAAPAEAVGGFLDALGVAPERIPAGLEARAGLYRSLLAGRRMLLLLDNARDVDQVRPLLPGSPGCLVVVTSRTRLGGLAVGEGARLLSLDVLTRDEARQLLAGRLGAGRVAGEPAAASELIGLCARLPLALAIAAARAAGRPGFPLAELAAELRDAAGRLDGLEAGDAASSVRAVFSWSCRGLSDPAGRMFRLLGVHPGPDISAPAAASLAAVSLPLARRALQELAAANLLTEQSPGRYSFHDLLRAYAAEQARDLDGGGEPRAAVGRVLSHYLHTAYAAALVIVPTREPIALPPAGPGVVPESLAGHQQALSWFEAEYRVLLSAVALAAGAGCDIHAWQIPWALTDFQDQRGHWQDWAMIQHAALAAATRAADVAGQAAARRLLGQARARLGDYDQARTQLTDGLGLFRRLGDRAGEARAHQALGFVANRQGRHAAALRHGEQALDLFRAAGSRAGQAAALNGVGWSHAQLGQYEQARTSCQQALVLYRELGARLGEAGTWDSLGYAEHKLGRLAEAAESYQHALRIMQELGDLYHQAEILSHLGDIRQAAGDPLQAQQAWQQALDILDKLHHPDAGQVRRRLGQP